MRCVHLPFRLKRWESDNEFQVQSLNKLSQNVSLAGTSIITLQVSEIFGHCHKNLSVPSIDPTKTES